MVDLGKWAKENATYFKLNVGEEMEVIFLGAKVIPDKFDPEQEAIQYKFDTEYGKKFFESKSTGIATTLADVKVGQHLKIRKVPYGDKGKYEIEPLDVVEEAK